MTTTTRPLPPSPLAAPDVAIRAFRAEANARHALWKQHIDFCLRCAFGSRCRTADDLHEQARSAELRVMRADPAWRWS